ncbi:MAG TPA: S8 family peptidase [Thermoanaerobaculia bacterium]|jgi:subtilisin family serine protease|nr:S8 family peptidase [Thermoanaerobaculia bacterium]
MTQDPPEKRTPRSRKSEAKPKEMKSDPDQQRVSFGRATAPPDLNDPERRRQWGLPVDNDQPGDYMVEINVAHYGGIKAAALKFKKIYEEIVGNAAANPPLRVGQTYFHCFMSANDWRRLIERDETDPETGPTSPKERAIYRIWPDFPIKRQITQSKATVKADAALRSYQASGAGIVWAVIDSGIKGDHPHFGLPSADGKPVSGHTLLDPLVFDLHRDFSNLNLADPDEEDTDIEEEERRQRIQAHRDSALSDEFGHGTHVAGIIAGGIMDENKDKIEPHVYERKFSLDDQDRRKPTTMEERKGIDPLRLHGVAPKCHLISLKVLDDKGNGRTSNVIRALDYIRASLNANPKLMLVHGINISLGYEFDAQIFACGQSPLCVEVDRLVQSGVVVVTAAGNTGYGTAQAQERPTTRVGLSNTINDPGNAALAITVGATHRDSPHTYGVSYFSSKGPTGDGRLKPDLVAPGERITSCAAGANTHFIREKLAQPNQSPQPSPTPKTGDATPDRTAASDPKLHADYIDESGTSMAAPHVSGCIAAFLSIRREFIGRPWEVKKIFLDSATPLGRERYFEGHGLIDLMRAIQSI